VRQHREVAADKDDLQVAAVRGGLGELLQHREELWLLRKHVLRVIDDERHGAAVLGAADHGGHASKREGGKMIARA